MNPLRLFLLAVILPVFGDFATLRADEFTDAQGAILARIAAPKFAARDFPITDFGAAEGSDCTEALAKAIAACHAGGGGRVVLPAGVWLTGAVRLRSNVNLHLAEGATLRFSPESTKYLPVVLTRFEGLECMSYSPLIYAFEQENVAVTGKGTLDGSANWETWWSWNNRKTGTPTWQVAARKKLDQEGNDGVPVAERVYGEGSFLRPNFIQPYRCKNVLIEGVTIINSPMWEIHPVLCTNVTVRGVTVRSLGPNNDGCDPESCRDVLIEDCVFETGDDCIAIKSGRNNDGRRVGMPCENIVIRRCTMKDGHGGVTLGSEVSGGVRHVFVSDCKMDSPHLDRAFRFKSNAVRGGVIEDVHIRSVEIGRVAKAVLGVEFDYEEGTNGPHRPILRNVFIENVTSQSSGSVTIITAIPGAVIENLRLKDCVFRGVEKDDILKQADPPLLENVTVERAGTKMKPRVFVLTDIENEPDDAMSMVRFLTYANQFDVEGLIATTSIHQKKRVAPQRIRQIVTAYGKVRDNLELHEPGFPTGERLLGVVSEGLPVYGLEGVGEGKDSPGSELLIRAIDRDDPRPVWVPVWGGSNVLAQALWKIRATRPADALAKAVAKLRVYTICDQDDSGPWLRKEFPGVFYIVSPGLGAGGAYHKATWSGISGDFFHARCDGADFQIVSNEWLDHSIRKKGPLGAEYPRWEYLMEGDTPSFLNLINNGLSVPEHPDWGGWGGRYELYTPRPQKWHVQPETRPIWTDANDEVLGVDGRWHDDNHATIWRWRSAFQNDFAARMDWTIKPRNEANHPPVPKLGHPARLTAKPGERLDLSAEGTTDPDGDAVSYEWFYYNEAGSFPLSSARSGQPLEIHDFDQQKAWFTVPTSRVMPPGTGDMHIILAVTDHGTPRLTRYQRVIVEVR